MFNLPSNSSLGKLKLDFVIEFFDIPRLFTCSNQTGIKYLVLSVHDDYELFEWLYLPVSNDRLSLIFSKQISLKEVFLSPEDGYLFYVKSNFSGDVSAVEAILPEQIDDDDLPGNNVYIENTDKVALGFGVIDPKIAAISSRREVCNFHFYSSSTQPEIDVKDLGCILTSFQELANALGQYCDGDVTLKGAIPAEIMDASKFRVSQVFEGSFGLQIKSKSAGDLFDDSLASDILQELINLFESRDHEDNISNKLHELQGRVASKYKSFLKDLSKLNTPLKVEWGSVKSNRGYCLKLSKDEIFRAYELVSKIDIDMSESVHFRANLLGLDVETKRYRVKRLDNDEVYAGKISDECLNKVSHSKINDIYDVIVKKVIETNSSSGSETTKWLLVDLGS